MNEYAKKSVAFAYVFASCQKDSLEFLVVKLGVELKIPKTELADGTNLDVNGRKKSNYLFNVRLKRFNKLAVSPKQGRWWGQNILDMV